MLGGIILDASCPELARRHVDAWRASFVEQLVEPRDPHSLTAFGRVGEDRALLGVVDCDKEFGSASAGSWM